MLLIEANAFLLCRSLTEIEIPSSVCKIGKDAFFYCTSLKKLKIFSQFITIEKNAFHDCHSLDQIIIHSELNYIFEEFKGYAKIINFDEKLI